jgi:transcriptional regulator with PAS, ATPase and Fis domain
VWRAIEGVAAGEECLHIRGETGTGKELAARHFHQSTERRKGPLSALNCATIPPALAERVLFGAKKGAYSGAEADSEGVIQAAHGGTLFLDEVAELDLAVQAKLLRVLEDGQVMPLGATKPVPVDVRLCSATHRDLSEEVARGRFRQDLYFRIGLPKVELPPLRARLEDLPLLLLGIAARAPGKPACHASLVEAALLRPWPGNVRELEKRVTDAARAAAAAGDKSIRASHLARATAPTTSRRPRLESITSTELPVDSSTREPLTRAAIERALRDTGGNVTAAAVALGLHRTQLRRLLLRLKIGRTQP